MSAKKIVKENVFNTFFSYIETAIQLFVAGKPIPKEMLTYWFHWQTVAHELAFWHPSWVTNDPEILHLKNDENKTVKEILIEQIMAGEKHGS